MRDIGIVIFSCSWGEVDWILPVLYKLKELQPELKLVALFQPHPFLWSQRNKEMILTPLLDTIIDSYAEPDFTRVKFVLKDFNPDDPFRNRICQRSVGAKIVVYPHSTAVKIHQDCNAPIDNKCIIGTPWAKLVPSHDLMLLATQSDVVWWKQRTSVLKPGVVGCPRYDPWWVNKILHDPKILKSEEKKIASKYKVILFVTRAPHKYYLSESTWEYIIRSTAEVVLKDPNNFLLVKPHPKQDVRRLTRSLSSYDRCMITKLHPLQLASLADLTIATYTSCTLDSLAVGTPVIEFFQYPRPNEEFVMLDNGKRSSMFTYLGLTLPVNTREELENALYNTDISDVYKREKEKFASLMVKDSALKAAKLILKK